MHFTHAALAASSGTLAVTIRYHHCWKRHGTAIDHDEIGANCDRRDSMEYQGKAASRPMTPLCGIPASRFLADSVENQIIDFLDGRTHGEALLHALYDHVLDEAVPERMRALFRK